ncbi:MAG: glycosyltransferase [Bacteroidales bacterium]|nr:glycosyltransferase [Bacteroidales bacterium]
MAILILFGVITLIQLVYYYVIYGRFAFHRKKSALGFRDIPVSVVIVVRDDAALAVQNLPLLLEQQYSSYEIVIVNDRSRDEHSLQAIREYKDRFPNIKLVDLSTAVSTSRGKKMAISMGVKCATYDHILLTSPDCKPASRLWLSKMAQNFQFQQRIVLGYNTFEKKKGIYSHFLHFDNLISAVQYFAHALMHSTYRGDLNNVAFVRPLFYKQNGFIAYNHLLYGEEDIFIHRASTPNNVAVEFDPDAVTLQQHSPSYGYWRLHKVSLFFTRKFNSLKNRILLSGYELTNLLFYGILALAIVISMHQPLALYIAIGIAVLRIASLYVVMGIAAKKLHETQIIPQLLFYDLLFAILTPLLWLSAKLHHKKIAQ